jgi:hypothetical protein
VHVGVVVAAQVHPCWFPQVVELTCALHAYVVPLHPAGVVVAQVQPDCASQAVDKV